MLTETRSQPGHRVELEFTANRDPAPGERQPSCPFRRNRTPLTRKRSPPILEMPVFTTARHPPTCCTAIRSRSMTSVAQVLKTKPENTVYTIAAEDSVYNAIKLMAEKQIGALVVTDGDAIAGIITERDYARKVVLMERSSKATPVRDIMSRSVRFVRPDQTTEECMAIMTDRRMRHLPVIDHERLIGMVSIGDLVKNIIPKHHFPIQMLEQYITGERPM